MTVTAKLNYLRIAPRKVRLVADLIREKPIEQAQNILHFSLQKSAQPLLKLLNQAAANAKNNFELEEKNLYIAKIVVDQGPMLKRWRPRSRGQAYEIQKKTSHITLVLEEIKEGAGKVKKREIKKQSLSDDFKKEERDHPEKPTDKKLKIDKTKIKEQKQFQKPKREKGIKKIFRRKAF